jgi:hypothetical protein
MLYPYSRVRPYNSRISVSLSLSLPLSLPLSLSLSLSSCLSVRVYAFVRKCVCACVLALPCVTLLSVCFAFQYHRLRHRQDLFRSMPSRVVGCWRYCRVWSYYTPWTIGKITRHIAYFEEVIS